MAETAGLKIVDAYDLDDELRSLLKPGEMVKDKHGRRHRLPRYFYEIESHDEAKSVKLTQHFGLNELIVVDFREAPRLQDFPRYVPCAVRVLAFYLESARSSLGLSVHIAVNGGYRSPSHKLSPGATPHMWGTAADLFKIGTTILKEEDSIQKYRHIIEEASDDLWVMPYGHEIGQADDHIHIDLGYVSMIPREISEDRMELPQQQPRFAFEDRRANDRRNRPADTDPSPPQTAAQGEERGDK